MSRMPIYNEVTKYEDELLEYRKTHSWRDCADWLYRTYGIKVCQDTIRRYYQIRDDEIEHLRQHDWRASKKYQEAEKIKKDIIQYSKTHCAAEIERWLKRNYHLNITAKTIMLYIERWKVEAEREVKDMHLDGASYRDIEDKTGISKSTAQRIVNGKEKPAVLAPATLADFNDADIIQELRKRGYRVYSERYIKKWGNHYKKQLIEITQ